jgi:hypothetical protein
VDIQVIAHHLHLLGLRIVVVNDSLQQMGKVDLRAPLSRLDAPPAAKRLVTTNRLAVPRRRYSWSVRLGQPGALGIGSRMSSRS